jgi:hypothetical protein
VSALEGFSRPRPDDVLERLGREKEAEVVTGVFTIPLARMGPLCRCDRSRSCDAGASSRGKVSLRSQMPCAEGLVKVALWHGVEVAGDLTHHLRKPLMIGFTNCGCVSGAMWPASQMLAHSQSGRASNNSFTSSRDGRVVFVEDITSVS